MITDACTLPLSPWGGKRSPLAGDGEFSPAEADLILTHPPLGNAVPEALFATEERKLHREQTEW
jgi:hypothetical protein